MKVRTSYFYQIRNFTNNMIPVSTAVWDPRWFHTGNNIGEYKDKNGVWNGIRIPILSPAKIESGECTLCRDRKPDNCKFIMKYRNYLLSLDFNAIYHSLEDLASTVQDMEKFKEEPIIVLIVHEHPENPCSERKALQELFNKNGIECKELEYPIVN